MEGRSGGDPIGGRTGGRVRDGVTGTGTEGVDESHGSRNGSGTGSRQEVERRQSSTAVNPAQGNNNSWVPVAICKLLSGVQNSQLCLLQCVLPHAAAGFFTASLVVLGLAAYRKL